VALLLVQLFFGIHYVAAKMVVGWVSPAAWILCRVGAAALILLAWILFSRGRWPRGLRQWGALAAFALFGVALNQVLFMEGIARTTPAHSALIQTAIPLWVVAFGLLLRRERLTVLRAAGLLVALLGVLVLLRADQFRVAGEHLAGDLLCLANTASYGFFLVISKRYLARHDPLTTTAHIFLLGAIPVAAYGAPDFAAVEWGGLPAPFWGWAAFIVIFGTIGTYFLIYWALRRVPSSVVALFIYLQPVIATVLDGWLRGVWPSPRFYPAAALVFFGVGMGVRGGRAPQPAPAPAP
jgi:drug/metabolite transporter (DMT)-like permease